MILKSYKHIVLALLTISCISCSSTSENEEVNDPEPIAIVVCSNTDIDITEQDNIVIQHATDPVVWNGTFSENSIRVSFTVPISSDGESESFNFIFDKSDECLKLNRAYKFYDGNLDDVSAITEINVTEFYIKSWEIDTLFAGNIVYIDPHDKSTYSRNIWVNLEESTGNDNNVLLFKDCYLDKLPIEIDLNNDNIVDYSLSFEENRDIGNEPNFNIYSIKLESKNQNKNHILSPTKNQGPHEIIFEPPFTSENTSQYLNDLKDAIDVFYEFDAPYESYNYFLNNNLTYKKTLENNKEDYFLIRMEIGSENFYGWIKFSFNSDNCDAEILDTFLNTNANEHVFVD